MRIQVPLGVVVGLLSLSPSPVAEAPPYHPDQSILLTTDTCVSDHGWKARSCSQPPKAAERATQFYQSFLEYDDEGKPLLPHQRAAILQKIRHLAADGVPILVVAYVHGWHHNAHPEDGNVKKFRAMLARHYDAARRRFEMRNESKLPAALPAVLGVYIGWSGKQANRQRCWSSTLTFGLVTEACNFWERSTVADVIGTRKNQDGGCEPANLRCDLKEIAEQLRKTGAGGHMIVYGHSLGGRILTRAFQPDVVAGAEQPLGPRTLIATVNAAVGADCFTPAFGKAAPDDKHPTWINFTSKDDQVTSYTYRMARTWSWGLITYVSACDEQLSEQSGRTIGHYDQYVTHWLHFDQWKGPFRPAAAQAETAETKPPWFAGAPGNHLLAYLMRKPLEVCKPGSSSCYLRNSADHYDMVFEKRKAFGKFGTLWNISTDGNAIQIGSLKDRQADGYPDHNGYVQTNLTRLLLELLYAQ